MTLLLTNEIVDSNLYHIKDDIEGDIVWIYGQKKETETIKEELSK